MRRCVLAAAEAQMERIAVKLRHFDALEAAVDKEREVLAVSFPPSHARIAASPVPVAFLQLPLCILGLQCAHDASNWAVRIHTTRKPLPKHCAAYLPCFGIPCSISHILTGCLDCTLKHCCWCRWQRTSCSQSACRCRRKRLRKPPPSCPYPPLPMRLKRVSLDQLAFLLPQGM